jgi:response regulator NasT
MKTSSALIIAKGEQGIAYFSEVLNAASFEKIVAVHTAGEARRLLIEHDFDICIINAPLPDEHGERLAQTIATKGISSVIMCIKAEMFDEISTKVEDYGIITVAKPINRTLFWSALKIAMSAHKRMKLIQNENYKLVQKIEDIRLVDRAKCVLISYLSMSEKEAHRYIEKQAMDMRISKKETAERILKTYEN